MVEMPIYKHQWRRETFEYWTTHNITPDEGEPIFEIDKDRFKVGDGITPWSELPYFTADGEDSEPVPTTPTNLTEHIEDPTPHPAYDDGPSFLLLYQNAKV